jgi:uncharacterized repeat protein (TIGR01451 family)
VNSCVLFFLFILKNQYFIVTYGFLLKLPFITESLTYLPGGMGVYTIIVTNNGPADLSGATVTDGLPNGVTMTSTWTCTPSSANSSCNTVPSTTDPISIDVDIVNGDAITISVPVQFSPNMVDY